MTDRERAFLAAIIANPDDDLPRLVFSDYLDEQGQGERSEFIRVQCELALNRQKWSGRLVPIQHLGRREKLERREGELLTIHCQKWAGDIYQWLSPGCDIVTEGIRVYGDRNARCIFRRGFCESITCTWADFARHADAIREQTPLREVVLTSWPDMEVPPHNSYGHRLRGGKVVFTSANLNRGISIKRLLEREFPGITFTLPRDKSRSANALAQATRELVDDPDGRILYGDPSAPRQHMGIINARGSR